MNTNLILLNTINELIELNENINNYINYKNSISIKEIDTKKINNQLLLNSLNSDINNLINSIVSADITDGGKGSGFFGHKGRPGKVGGSSKSGISFENLSNEQIKEVLDSKELKEKWGGAGQRLKNLALTNQAVMKRIQRTLSTGHGIFNSQEERDAADELLKTLPQGSDEWNKLNRKLKQDDFFADLIDITESKFGNSNNSDIPQNNIPTSEQLNDLTKKENKEQIKENTYSDITISKSDNFSKLMDGYYILTSTDYNEAKRLLKELKAAGLENTSMYKDLLTIKKDDTSDRYNDNNEIEMKYILKPSEEAINNSLQNLNTEQGNTLKYLCNNIEDSDFTNFIDNNKEAIKEASLKPQTPQDKKMFGDSSINTIEYYKSLPTATLKAMYGFSSIKSKINITDNDADNISTLIDNSPFERRDCYRGDYYDKNAINKIKAGMTINEVMQLNSLKNKQTKGFKISNISYNINIASTFSEAINSDDFYDSHGKLSPKYKKAVAIIHYLPNCKSLPNYCLSTYSSEAEGYIKTDDWIVDSIEHDTRTNKYKINYKERGK